MKAVKVGLLGCGTVGMGVARILMDSKALIAERLGVPLVLKSVADIDTERDRGIRFEDGVMTADARKVVDDPGIDIIIEMIGGDTVAKALILQSIKN